MIYKKKKKVEYQTPFKYEGYFEKWLWVDWEKPESVETGRYKPGWTAVHFKLQGNIVQPLDHGVPL